MHLFEAASSLRCIRNVKASLRSCPTRRRQAGLLRQWVRRRCGAGRAELVAREVERGAADQARKREQRHFMARALECFATPVAFVDVSLPGWRAMHCSPAFSTVCFSPLSVSFCLQIHHFWAAVAPAALLPTAPHTTPTWGMQRYLCLGCYV